LTGDQPDFTEDEMAEMDGIWESLFPEPDPEPE
jgi:hypothetical protein